MPHITLDAVNLSVPTMTFTHKGNQVTRPITDHEAVIQNTLWGAIGTLNILHPGSRLAPPAVQNEVTALPADGKVQMQLMAQYIYRIFEQGVSLLALQEVPNPNSQNFRYLEDELRNLIGNSKLIDVDSLRAQWLLTGVHRFGTSILYNPSRFVLSTKAVATLTNRAARYDVISQYDKRTIPVLNIHGNFNSPQDTQDCINSFHGFCLGDLNIPPFTKDHNSGNNALRSGIQPTGTIDGAIYTLSTLDMVQDTFSRKVKPDYIPETDRISEIIIEPLIQAIRIETFESEKNKTQAQFINQLQALRQKLNSYAPIDSASYVKGEQLLEELSQTQADLFSKLTLETAPADIKKSIQTFRNTCINHIKDADKIMGHGWLYRVTEVLIKAVTVLFAAIGMALGMLGGQGLMNTEHRTAFKNTFFALNQTDSTKALNTFKQEALDEVEQGLSALI